MWIIDFFNAVIDELYNRELKMMDLYLATTS